MGNAGSPTVTRSQLLDAAIDGLIEEGYAGITVQGVAERAEVQPDAVTRHFAGHATLIIETMDELVSRLISQLFEPAVAGTDGERERWEVLIDHLWDVHSGPLFGAFLELWVAARSDNELHESLSTVFEDHRRRIVEGAIHAFPELVGRPGFGDAVSVGLATLRGLALLAFLPEGDPEAVWPAARECLIDLFETAANVPRTDTA